MMLLAIELEPTHYKSDLWNAFCSKDYDIFVVYTQSKNWSPDGGHNYLRFPEEKFNKTIMSGRGISGTLFSCHKTAMSIVRFKPDIVFISGYINAPTLLAIFICALLRKRYTVHADIFNNGSPTGKLSKLKKNFRDVVRKIIFSSATGVLSCGRLGRESAIVAGCNSEKVFDFPYVIDVSRILKDDPNDVPRECRLDLESGATVIFFSGRMIKRKGLDVLIKALAPACELNNWVLWIEGDGPCIHEYRELAVLHGIKGRCRFLGFCQPNLHSWFLRNSNIVVVPSYHDSWGLMVDEGMQLGKAVISSDRTGSGADRITDGHNGFIFPAGDWRELSRLLIGLLANSNQITDLGLNAQNDSVSFNPFRNVQVITKLVGPDNECA